MNSIHNIVPLIKYVRYELNATTNIDSPHSYTDEQIQFSRQLIEQWSNFIKFGQPKSSQFKNQWKSINNLSNAFVMHLQVNQSEVKQLTIPSSVLFWKNKCPIDNEIIDKSNQGIIHKITLTIILWSLLFNKVLSLSI